MKCLIADDDVRIRRMLKSVLERPGLEFLEAHDGSEAVALCQAHQPDLVIMDVEMHPMDGITATRAIREHNIHCPVLILSQYDSPGFRHAAAQAGAFAYRSKDDLQDIIEVLAKHIQPPD